MAYDRLNRLTSRSYTVTAPTEATPTVTYTYGLVGNNCGSYSVGKLCSISSSISSTSYSNYDSLGRARHTSQVTSGQAFPTDYAYDLGGNSTTQTYPSGRTVTVSYDDAGRIDGVTGQKTGEANRTYASDF